MAVDHDPNHPAPAGSSSSNKAEASSTKDLNALRTRSQNQKPTSDDEKGPLGEKKPEADIFYVLKTKLETVDELFKRLDAVSSSVENVRTSLKKLEQQNSSAAPETTPTSSSTPRNNTSWSSTTTSPEEKSGEDHTASSVNGNDAASAAAEKSGSTATSGVGNMSATGALPTTAQTGDAVTAKKRSSLTKTLEKLQQQQREIWREIRATVTTKFIEDMALMDFDALFDKLMQQLAAPPSCGDGDDGGVDEEDLEELRHIEEVESLGAQIVVPVDMRGAWQLLKGEFRDVEDMLDAIGPMQTARAFQKSRQFFEAWVRKTGATTTSSSNSAAFPSGAQSDSSALTTTATGSSGTTAPENSGTRSANPVTSGVVGAGGGRGVRPTRGFPAIPGMWGPAGAGPEVVAFLGGPNGVGGPSTPGNANSSMTTGTGVAANPETWPASSTRSDAGSDVAIAGDAIVSPDEVPQEMTLAEWSMVLAEDEDDMSDLGDDELDIEYEDGEWDEDCECEYEEGDEDYSEGPGEEEDEFVDEDVLDALSEEQLENLLNMGVIERVPEEERGDDAQDEDSGRSRSSKGAGEKVVEQIPEEVAVEDVEKKEGGEQKEDGAGAVVEESRVEKRSSREEGGETGVEEPAAKKPKKD